MITRLRMTLRKYDSQRIEKGRLIEYILGTILQEHSYNKHGLHDFPYFL